MRIPVDTEALMRTVGRHWQQQQQIVASSSARIATGTRLASAVDDAAGVAIAERMRSQFEALYQAGRNAQDGVNFVEIAQDALTQTTDLVQRLRVFALQSANGAFDGGQRSFLQRATVLTLDELDAITRRANANGIGVLDGSRSNLRIQTGPHAGDGLDIGLRAANRESLGLGELSVATQQDAVSALDRLDEAIDVLNEHRAEMAAAQNRMMRLIETLGAQAEHAQATHARISDADIGQEMARRLRAEIASQAGAAMMVQVRQATETVMQLLLPSAPNSLPSAVQAQSGASTPSRLSDSSGASLPTAPLPTTGPSLARVAPIVDQAASGPFSASIVTDTPEPGAVGGFGDPVASGAADVGR